MFNYLITILLLITFSNFAFSAENFIINKQCIFESEEKNSNKNALIGSSYKISQITKDKIKIFFDNKIFTIDKDCGYIKKFDSFFSNSSITDLPSEPRLNSFDADILKLCSKLDDSIRSEDFLKIVEKYSILNSLYEDLDNSLNADSMQSIASFKKMFVDIWMKENAFKRIFCGLINNNDIQGPHYVGRYIQGYNEGWLGYDGTCKNNYYVYPVYFFGSFYVTQDGELKNKCPMNFFYALGAKELLFEATKAFKKTSKNDDTCMHYISHNDDKIYTAVFTKKNGAISDFEASLKRECTLGTCECS